MARARKFALELPESSYADSVLWLQQKLGHASLTLTDDEPVKLPRPPEVWLKAWDGSHMRVDLRGIGEEAIDVAELTVAIELKSGEVYVGQVIAQHPTEVILHRIGFRDLRIPMRLIRRAFLLGTHTFAEERAVRCRQRCGQPAAVFGNPRPNELSNPPTT